jgi:GMP synthase-like glutamine amidotransferase
MRIHVLQHAAYEGPGEIGAWALTRGHTVAITHLYRGDALPALHDFDALVVMGGEMNIYEDRDWPWLKPERAFIAAALRSGKPALGICLGAQLISDALGGRVTQNPEFEIGWFPVEWTTEATAQYAGLRNSSTVLHWHGDTFSLPEGATRLAVSEGCADQGFVIPGKCLGLQFHIEVDPGLVNLYVKSQDRWPKGRFVQEPEVIGKSAPKFCAANLELLHSVLDKFFA